MRYVKSKKEEFSMDLKYRNYVSEGIRAVAENTSKMFGGTTLSYKFLDLLYPEDAIKNEKESEKRGEDIINQVTSTLTGLGG